MQYQGPDLATFGKQIQFALDSFSSPNIEKSKVKNIVIAGLGGSGIAGRMVERLYIDRLPVPYIVFSDYFLPKSIDENTLVILCSYSGNTEETLAMAEQASKSACQMIAISTGGKLQEFAEKHSISFYPAESGFQPRMALGYSFTYLQLILSSLYDWNLEGKLRELSEVVSNHEIYKEQAKDLLQKLTPHLDKKFIVLADYFGYSAGLRFCQQINENSKLEAFIHEIPETNHNVIESYYGELNSVFFIMNSGSNERVNLRFDFNKRLLEENNNVVIDLNLNSSELLPLMKMVYCLDWLSLWLADYQNLRSDNIKNIKALKAELSSQQIL